MYPDAWFLEKQSASSLGLDVSLPGDTKPRACDVHANHPLGATPHVHESSCDASSTSLGKMMRHRPLAHNNQRRILSKAIRPTFNSEDDDNEDNSGPISTIKYSYYLIFAAGCWYMDYTDYARWIVGLSTLHWLGLISKLISTIRKRTNVHQIAGTVAFRQRVYYYVDYWLSTFPYAFPFPCEGLFLFSIEQLLTSGHDTVSFAFPHAGMRKELFCCR